MTNNLSLFDFESHEVRTVMVAKEPWFVAADVCKVLGLPNVSMAVSRLDEDEKAGINISDTSSNGVTQVREVLTVSESGLYSLTFTSRKEDAKRFKKWVTSEVLPSIRKTGKYDASCKSQLPEKIDLDAALETQRRSKDSVSAIAARNALALRDQGYSDDEVVELADVSTWKIKRANDYVGATRLGEALEDSAEFDDYKVTGVIMNKILNLAGFQIKDGIDWLQLEAAKSFSSPDEYTAAGRPTAKIVLWDLEATYDKLFNTKFPGDRTLYDVIKEENTKPKTLYTNQWAALLYPDTPNDRFQQTKELILRLWQAGFIEKGMYGVITATELAAGVCVQEGPKSIKWDVDAAMAALLLEEDLREAEFQARPMPKAISVY